MRKIFLLFFVILLFSLFPKVCLASSDLPTQRLYTSQINDDTTGLYYYNARYYDPSLGIFTSADQAQGPNRYSYVGGNPIMRNDPSGNYAPINRQAVNFLAGGYPDKPMPIRNIGDFGRAALGYAEFVLPDFLIPDKWGGKNYISKKTAFETQFVQALPLGTLSYTSNATKLSGFADLTKKETHLGLGSDADLKRVFDEAVAWTEGKQKTWQLEHAELQTKLVGSDRMITGYHTTSLEKASSILKEGDYHSPDPTLWLEYEGARGYAIQHFGDRDASAIITFRVPASQLELYPRVSGGEAKWGPCFSITNEVGFADIPNKRLGEAIKSDMEFFYPGQNPRHLSPEYITGVEYIYKN